MPRVTYVAAITRGRQRFECHLALTGTPRIAMRSLVLALVLVVCGVDTTGATRLEVLRSPRCAAPAALPFVLERLRGGADADLDEEDDDADDDVEEGAVAGGDALENPFLDGTAGLPGMPGGPGLEDLASSLKDPAALQEALKQLQDPAVQQQVKQMLEDPTFQDSMKQYMEQITKDPQFESLKKQTEAMLQEEGFVESMTKAFADMGGAIPGQAKEALEEAMEGKEDE